jgi:hypothetical protein
MIICDRKKFLGLKLFFLNLITEKNYFYFLKNENIYINLFKII